MYKYYKNKNIINISKDSTNTKYFGNISVLIPSNLNQKFKSFNDSSFFISISGLIHNEKELLKNKKYDDIFELLIKLYKSGNNNLGEFLRVARGQFAIFIYDINKDKILVANDKFGLYSAYYYEDKDLFLFSNFAEDVIKNIDYKNNINYDAISDYLSLGIVQNRETFARGVKNLQEGSFLTKEKDKKIRIEQYYKQIFDDNNYSRERYLELVNDQLNKVVVDLYNYSTLPKAVCLTAGFDTRLINSILLKNRIKQLNVFTRFPIRDESEINKFAIPMDEKIGREFSKKFGLEYFLLGRGGDGHEIENGRYALINGLFGGELFGAESYNQPATLFRVKVPSTGKTHFLTNRFKNLLSRDSIETYYENINKIETDEWAKKVFIHKANLLSTTFFNNLEKYGGQDWQHPNRIFRQSSFMKAHISLYPYTDSSFLEIMYKIPFYELDHHIFYKKLLEKYYSKYLSVDILHCKKRHYKYSNKTKKLYIHRKIEEVMEKEKNGMFISNEERRKKAVKDFTYFLKTPVNLDIIDKGYFFHKSIDIKENDILFHRIEEMQKWFYELEN